jgi:hypothetical protein
MNLAGNETNHPEKIKKDMHTPGATLPKSFYMNAVGYLPDGTPLNMAGNEVGSGKTVFKQWLCSIFLNKTIVQTRLNSCCARS